MKYVGEHWIDPPCLEKVETKIDIQSQDDCNKCKGCEINAG